MPEPTSASVLDTVIVPKTLTVTELGNFLDVLFPYFIDGHPTGEVFNREYWQARELFEKILWDRNDTQRKSLIRSWTFASEKVTPAEFISRYSSSELAQGIQKSEQVLPFLFNELGYVPPIEFAITASELRTLLAPFLDYIAVRIIDDELFEQKIIWEVITRGYPLVQAVFWQWITEVQESATMKFGLKDALTIAVTLYNRDNEQEQVTEGEYHECLTYLDHPSKVVAAVAAKRLGTTYSSESTLPSWAKSLPEMLDFVHQKQAFGVCVAGGFLNNLIDGEGLGVLATRSDLTAVSFDVRAWALQVTIDSPDYEPYICSVMSFWFYIHEYFDYDVEAVLQMIDGGRYWIAMMCITESMDYGSLDVMRPALRTLMQVAPEDIVSRVKALFVCKELELDALLSEETR